MNPINKNKVGLVFGALFGTIHLIWALMVLFNLAESFINFILRLHFINPFFTIMPFSVVTALGLIIVTSIIGYIFGWIGAFFWEKLHRGM